MSLLSHETILLQHTYESHGERTLGPVVGIIDCDVGDCGGAKLEQGPRIRAGHHEKVTRVVGDGGRRPRDINFRHIQGGGDDDVIRAVCDVRCKRIWKEKNDI